VVLLVRDTGRPLSLAVFDATEVAYAVAQSPVPVVAGLGGAGETTVTDDVAHVALPTGQAAADWVLHRLGDAERALHLLAGEVAEEAERAEDRARADLEAARDAAVAEAETARVRAAEARRRLRTRGLVVAAVPVAALLGAAVATGSTLPLLGVAAVAAVLLGTWAWTSWAGSDSTISRRSRRMSAQDDDFAAVLAGLRKVRDELAATSSPEAVRRLQATADQLVAQGERVLGRPLADSREAVSA
jgi:exonuclease VII large subunit